jgi:hypothetical protein
VQIWVPAPDTAADDDEDLAAVDGDDNTVLEDSTLQSL